MKPVDSFQAFALFVWTRAHHAGDIPSLFSTNYLPHRFCYLAQPGLIWTNVIADAAIAASYAMLFGSLLWITVRLRKVSGFQEYLWIFVSFALFIVACGATHVMEVVTVWLPAYPLSAAMKVICAIASVPTAIFFARITPVLLKRIPDVLALLAISYQERDEAREELTLFQKITAERRKKDEQLAALNTQLNQIMDSTAEGIVKLGVDWTILYGNRVSCDILPDLIPGRSYWDCFPALRGSETETRMLLAMEGREKAAWEFFYEPYHEYYAVHAYPTEGGLSIFFVPITVRKRLEQQLEEERGLREKRMEALSVMAGGLAHEISNPLAIIQGTASELQRLVLEGGVLDPTEVLMTSNRIANTADRAHRILRGLRGFAREAGNDPMEYASIYEIVEETIQMQESRFARQGIDLLTTLEADIPFMLCRETQVGQIITNLVNNAYDAITQQECAERWVRVEASVLGDSLQVDVVDSGPGIDEAARKRLMEPFFTTKPRGLGMGVGLSLSRAIANEHGGSLVLCENTTNTCFRLLLPMMREAAEQDSAVWSGDAA